MKERLLILVIAVCMAANVRAEIVSGTCGTNLTWTLDTETGVLDITGSGDMANYMANATRTDCNVPWFAYRNSITTVNLSDGLTSIGAYAFFKCSNLTSVIIPEGVTEIKLQAFDSCESLQNVQLPNSLTVIFVGAFYHCTGLTSIVIPNSVTTMGWEVFRECTNLVDVTLSESLDNVNAGLFFDCRSLSQISIPAHVTTLSTNAFMHCASLTSIIIPDSVTTIGWGVFDGCTGLQRIVIGASVNSIGEFVFNGCTNLQQVYNCSAMDIYPYVSYYTSNVYDCPPRISVAANNAAWGSIVGGGMYFAGDTCTLTAVPNPDCVFVQWSDGNRDNPRTVIASTDTTYTADFQRIAAASGQCGDNLYWSVYAQSGVLEITGSGDMYNYAVYFNGGSSIPWYAYRDSIVQVLLPDSLTSIGNAAFQDCTNLTHVAIPSTVTHIGERAFRGCSRLTDIQLPEGITEIALSAFYQCVSLTEITIPETVTMIDALAFFGCTGLTSILIPAAVTSIGRSAFYQCNNLKTVFNCSALNITKGSSDYGEIARYADKVYGCPVTVSIETNNAEWGSVTSTGVWATGNTITLTATPAYGYQFNQWNDGNTDNPRRVVLTADTAFAAEFGDAYYTLTLLVNDSLAGTVDGSGVYKHNTQVLIEAFPADRYYRFVDWSDGSAQNPRRIILTSDTTLTANFIDALPQDLTEHTDMPLQVVGGEIRCDSPIRIYNPIGQDVTALNGNLPKGIYIVHPLGVKVIIQ